MVVLAGSQVFVAPEGVADWSDAVAQVVAADWQAFADWLAVVVPVVAAD